MFSYILIYNFVECVPKTVEYDLEVIYNLQENFPELSDLFKDLTW